MVKETFSAAMKLDNKLCLEGVEIVGRTQSGDRPVIDRGHDLTDVLHPAIPGDE